MTQPTQGLTAKSRAVLEMIAAGSSYEQILAAYPDFTYLDIFAAASEALNSTSANGGKLSYTLEEKRERYPRAYEKWTDEEDAQLKTLVRSGGTVAQIAGRLQRNRGAIRSRVVKLNLVEELTPKEQQRLRRLVAGNVEPGS